ncbi:MAG: methylenetetrahydrofolate reductase [Clostridia bacterium]|nr:methylenetetrahydrofolate reductase [NAD(P)H] [Clostridia bacterium]
MKISTIYEKKRTVFSLEVFPPKKTSSVDSIYETLDGLRGINPDFISVTYGAGGNIADSNTRNIAEIIKKEYGIESMAHLTCVSTTYSDAGIILDDFSEHGIENILALRGDISPDHPPKHDFSHASDLAAFIKKNGAFDIGGACYPETHAEAENSEKDIENLKIKIESGVTFLISQLFFNNRHFYDFSDKIVKAGINVPVSAGIMPVMNKKQIERMVTMCGASIPNKLSKLMMKYADDSESLKSAGIEYAVGQIEELVSNGVRGIHLYTMNNPEVGNKIYNSIKNIL